VKGYWNDLDYEPLRAWALRPSSVRPPGLAQILRGGLVSWVQVVPSLPIMVSQTDKKTPAVCASAPSLSLLVAAMIAEVLR